MTCSLGLGQRVSVMYANSEAEAVRRYFRGWPQQQPGYSARLQDYSDALDVEVGKRAADAWGRLD